MRLSIRFARETFFLLAIVTILAVAGSVSTSVYAANGILNVVVVDSQTKKPIPFRLHLKTDRGQGRRLPKLVSCGDHVIVPGQVEMKLPLGNYQFEIECGPEYTTRQGRFQMVRFGNDTQQLVMTRVGKMSENGWYSIDMDIHRPLAEVPLSMQADGLDLAPVITWFSSAQKQLTENDWSDKPLPRPLIQQTGLRTVFPMAGRFEVPGCEVNLINLHQPVLPPTLQTDAVTYLLDLRKKNPDLWIDGTNIAMEDLTTMVALGLLDSVEILDSDLCRTEVEDRRSSEIAKRGRPADKALYPSVRDVARWKQDIYFHLLNCGLKVLPSGGSGTGVSANPIGYNRVYVYVPGEFSWNSFWQAYRSGAVVVTNGPLLCPSVNGFPPGHVFQYSSRTGSRTKSVSYEIGLNMAIREPISYLEIIKNGQVEHSIRFEDYAKTGKLPKLEFNSSGWFLVRAVTDLSKTYRYAITAPWYVEFDEQPFIDRDSVLFFSTWHYDRGVELQKYLSSESGLALDRETKNGLIRNWTAGRSFWIMKDQTKISKSVE